MIAFPDKKNSQTYVLNYTQILGYVSRMWKLTVILLYTLSQYFSFFYFFSYWPFSAIYDEQRRNVTLSVGMFCHCPLATSPVKIPWEMFRVIEVCFLKVFYCTSHVYICRKKRNVYRVFTLSFTNLTKNKHWKPSSLENRI